MPKVIETRKLKYYWLLYGFILPSVFLVALFSYYPALNALYHSFYRWNGEDISYFIGMKHFNILLGKPFLWIIVFVFLAGLINTAKNEDSTWSNFFQLSCSIIMPAISLITIFFHKLAMSETQNYGVELGTGTLIFILLYLTFNFFVSDENENKWLYLSIPFIFLSISILKTIGLNSLTAWLFTALISASILWLYPSLKDDESSNMAKILHAFFSVGLIFWALAKYAGGDKILWGGFYVTAILVAFNIVKMIPSIVTAVVIHRLKSEKWNYIYRVFFVVPMIIPGMVYLLIWKFFFNPNEGIFNKILIYTKCMDILIALDKALGWGGIFREGIMPVWLGNEHLVLPALILWGFPWVGVVGVLIYLAGLQNIDQSVYEAADLDGANPLQKFLHIELPLIMNQVKINMVLMIISTLQAYSHILILFGVDGGPNGKLMVPGLLMFRSAFQEGRAGYACAIGLIIFFFILALTEINNKYLRVEK